MWKGQVSRRLTKGSQIESGRIRFPLGRSSEVGYPIPVLNLKTMYTQAALSRFSRLYFLYLYVCVCVCVHKLSMEGKVMERMI